MKRTFSLWHVFLGVTACCVIAAIWASLPNHIRESIAFWTVNAVPAVFAAFGLARISSHPPLTLTMAAIGGFLGWLLTPTISGPPSILTQCILATSFMLAGVFILGVLPIVLQRWIRHF